MSTPLDPAQKPASLGPGLTLWTAQPGSDAQTELGSWFNDQAQAALTTLVEIGKAHTKQLTLIARELDPDAHRQLAKRRHDVKGALRTLGFVVQALESGYRFDDENGKAKIEALAKAVQVFVREQELLLRSLGG